MGSLKTWTSAETKASLSKSQTVVTTSSIHGEEPRQKRGCLSRLTSCAQPGQTKGWKPLSMSTPILSALVVFSLLIAAAIEVLAQRSAAYGGLALSPSLDAVPRYAMWSYLYGPNVVAVLYSLIWSWVDLDVKRMQPWFELSKQGGATADGSIFLDYPYDFVATAPLKAFKRRHWPVFLAGTAMMIVFWAITPLQSAILGTGVVTLTEPAMVYARSRLAPIEDQVNILDPEFLNSGYAVGWLGQAMPDFMTPEYANLPFYVEDSKFNSSNITWAATTTRYSTELDCWPAEVEGPDPARQWNFLNGQGCNATVTLNQFTNYSMYYIGYHSSPYASFALTGPECPSSANAQHQFLAVWAEPYNVTKLEFGLSGDFNVTALYCEPKYYKEQVNLRVDGASLKPIAQGAYETIDNRQALGEDEFNSTAFEFLLHSGVVDSPPPRDFPFLYVVEQHPRLRKANFSMPVSNMVGYAYSRDQRPATEYGDPKMLQEAYAKAHEYLFSLAISQLLINDTSSDFDTEGQLKVLQAAITVSRPLSAAVEGLLLLVAIMTTFLAWSSHSASSKLQSNPSSLTRLAKAFEDNPTLVNRFSRFDTYDDAALRAALQHVRFELAEDGRIIALGITTPKDAEGLKLGVNEQTAKSSETERYYDPIRPWALRTNFGILFVLILSSAVVVLSYFKHLESSNNGIIRPSDNAEVLQLLENFLPTIFATVMEPLWVLLTRLLCVLQPFRQLWKGQSKAESSIDSTYTSIPPQLVFWRAVRSRHWLLSIVCLIAFLANLLTIGLGAVFNEAPVTINATAEFKQAWSAEFNNQSVFDLNSRMRRDLITTSLYLDHLYVALSNLSYSTPLPPWTAQDFFFQPVLLNTTHGNEAQVTYTLRTRGFGANPNCTATESREIPLEFPDTVRNPDSLDCPDGRDRAALLMRETDLVRPEGRSAMEYCGTIMKAGNNETCDRELALAWGRMDRAEDANATADASFVSCFPSFRTAMFEVQVDSSGYILAYQMEGKESATLDYPDAEKHIDTLFIQVNQALNRIELGWRNDTLATDWYNYLMTLSLGSRAFLDPQKPTPDPKALLPGVEDIYARQFAIVLSLQQEMFEPADNTTVNVSISRPETRIFMDTPSFIISLSVLGLNLLVAICFYLRSAAFVLPRMPTTLGSTMAYIAPSRWVLGIPLDINRQKLTFSFGRFIGHDKQAHVGIEMDPFVVKVNPATIGREANSEVRSRSWRRGKHDEGGDWL